MRCHGVGLTHSFFFLPGAGDLGVGDALVLDLLGVGVGLVDCDGTVTEDLRERAPD